MATDHLETLGKILMYRGRTARRTYWLLALAGLVLYAVGAAIHPALSAVLLPALLAPATVLSIRRLHDAGMSGWHFWWGFVPYLGLIVLCILLAQSGQLRTNRYGPPTKRAKVPSAAPTPATAAPTPTPAASPPTPTPTSAASPSRPTPSAARPAPAPTLAELRAAIPVRPTGARAAAAAAPQATPSLDALRDAVARQRPPR